MSHIIKSNQDLLLIRDIWKKFYDNRLNIDFINDEIIKLLPSNNDEVLIKYDIRNRGMIVSNFSPKYRKIIL